MVWLIGEWMQAILQQFALPGPLDSTFLIRLLGTRTDAYGGAVLIVWPHHVSCVTTADIAADLIAKSSGRATKED